METIVIEKSNSQIIVLSDLEAMSHKAAELFIDISRNCIRSRDKFSVAISGGLTPRKLYTLLGSKYYCEQVDWQHIHLFWVDERCVSKEHEESNFRMTFDTLLSKVPIPEGNIHRMKGEEAPNKAAREYEEDLRRFFGMSGLPIFDLILLGMGEDGHTASLFPGSKSLGETARLAVPVYLGKQHRNRVTLTLPVLNNAARIIFLAAGRSKATVLAEILGDGEKKRRFPAGKINPIHGNVTWLIDQEAAGKLTGLII